MLGSHKTEITVASVPHLRALIKTANYPEYQQKEI